MIRVLATFRNGKIELENPVDWPDGTQVEVMPLQPPEPAYPNMVAPMSKWPEGFFERLRRDWGDEPFERPPQGEFEEREGW